MTTTEIKYIDTKEDCQKQIDEANRVCRGCGGTLTPIETVDNSGRPTFWVGCKSCQVFDHGTTKEIFQIAEQLVKEGYVHYMHMDRADASKTEEYKKYWKSSQIRGACGLVRDILNIHEQLTKQP